MSRALRKFIELSNGKQLDNEQRNMLSIAYKNKLTDCRNALRQLQLMDKNEFSTLKLNALESYYGEIHKEFCQICEDLIVSFIIFIFFR